MKRTTDSPKPDRVRDTMTATVGAIVDAIETGIADPAQWSAPWHHNDAPLPQRATDGYRYTGGNALYLWSLVAAGASPWWATYDQWQSIGGQVPKGTAAAAYLLRPMKRTMEDKSTGDKVQVFTGRFSAFPVWHAGQVTGWTPPPAPERPAVDDIADVHAAFAWAARTGARVEEHPNRGASYSHVLDVVTMPDRTRITSGHGAWSTIAHELTHWTGHETRLARTFGKRFGDDAYAAEELCAELGAAFTLAALGRSTEPRPDHAQYLASWLRCLKADPSTLWAVAGKASAAAAFLTDRAGIPAEPVLATV